MIKIMILMLLLPLGLQAKEKCPKFKRSYTSCQLLEEANDPDFIIPHRIHVKRSGKTYILIFDDSDGKKYGDEFLFTDNVGRVVEDGFVEGETRPALRASRCEDRVIYTQQTYLDNQSPATKQMSHFVTDEKQLQIETSYNQEHHSTMQCDLER